MEKQQTAQQLELPFISTLAACQEAVRIPAIIVTL